MKGNLGKSGQPSTITPGARTCGLRHGLTVDAFPDGIPAVRTGAIIWNRLARDNWKML